MPQQNIIIAAGPVIIEDDKVLLNQHGDKNMWKFPGGTVELDQITNWDNPLKATIKREVKEEMGIDIEILRPLKPMLVPRPNHDNEYVVLIHFLAKRIGEITPGDDIETWDWLPIDTLPDNCAPNIKPVLNSIHNA